MKSDARVVRYSKYITQACTFNINNESDFPGKANEN